MSGNTLRTKVASSVIIKVQEVFSPYLNKGLTIFRAISGIDGVNFCLKWKFEKNFEILLAYSICMEVYLLSQKSHQIKRLRKVLYLHYLSLDYFRIKDSSQSIKLLNLNLKLKDFYLIPF
jgi:hypothetical protein